MQYEKEFLKSECIKHLRLAINKNDWMAFGFSCMEYRDFAGSIKKFEKFMCAPQFPKLLDFSIQKYKESIQFHISKLDKYSEIDWIIDKLKILHGLYEIKNFYMFQK